MIQKLVTVSSASVTVCCWLNPGSRAMLLFCSDSKVTANVQKALPQNLYGNKIVSLSFISQYKEIVKLSCKDYFLLENKNVRSLGRFAQDPHLSVRAISLIREQILRINLLVRIKLFEDIESRRKNIRQGPVFFKTLWAY